MKTSVALCTYNGDKYLQQQLESILAQTSPVDEIIIGDDGSSDQSLAIIAQFQSKYPKIIRSYRNQTTIGSSKNFEKAISLCSGDLIFLSDQDDLWKENKVEKIIQHFQLNSSIDAVFSNADLIDAKGKKIEGITLWDAVFFIEDQLEKPIDLLSLMTSKRNMVTGATLCIKKQILEFVLPIPHFKSCYHDEWIALILAQKGTINYIKDPLISYRIHSQQQVGGKNSLSKKSLQKHLKLSNFVLGKSHPQTFQDFNLLSKTYFRNYQKFNIFSENSQRNKLPDFKQISQNNLELFLKYEKLLKKANPLFYFFRNLSDQIRGKRQLK